MIYWREWSSDVCSSVLERQRCCLQNHPACNRQLRVLSSAMTELGKSTALYLHVKTTHASRRENASECCLGPRRSSSQTLSCNWMRQVTVRQERGCRSRRG